MGKINWKSAGGITLVALVLTIIIIIILASVTINFMFGDGGLITRAEQAKELTEIAAAQEELEIVKTTSAIDGGEKINTDHFFNILEEEEIIRDTDSDIVDNEDGSYEITTDDGYIFEIIPVPDKDNATDIKIEYVGKSDAPRIRDLKIETTTNSAIVTVITTNAEGATYKYEYKKQGNTEWTTVE